MWIKNQILYWLISYEVEHTMQSKAQLGFESMIFFSSLKYFWNHNTLNANIYS